MSLLIDALKKAGDAREIHHVTGMDAIPDVAPDDYLGQKPAPARVAPAAANAQKPSLELTPTPTTAVAKEFPVPPPQSNGLALTLEEIKPIAARISIDDRIPASAIEIQAEPASTSAVSGEAPKTIPAETPPPLAARVEAVASPAAATKTNEPEQPPKAPEASQASAPRAQAGVSKSKTARNHRALPPLRVMVLGGTVILLGFIGVASYFYYQQQIAALTLPPLVPPPTLSPPADTAANVADDAPVADTSAKLVPPQPAPRAPEPMAARPDKKSSTASVAKSTNTAALSPESAPVSPTPIRNRDAVPDTSLERTPSAASPASAPTAGFAADPAPNIAPPPVAQPTPVANPPVAVAESRANPTEAALDNAYSSYQAGDWQGAAAAYRRVLAADAQNRDALLGLAAIAARNGALGQASDFYARLLMRDAKDAVALAGFVGVVGSLDPIHAQNELKSMLQQNPSAAFLRFALGNVYVAQQRWADAETEFFGAYRMEPSHPDYAYNLAISLDKLGERGSAVRYYQAALQNAKSASARFDAAAVEQRIRAISNNAGPAGS